MTNSANTAAIPARGSKTYALTATALMTGVICILSPMALPIGPVPISLTTFMIYLAIYILGWKKAAISILLFLLIGFAGLPVFSGFVGGPAKLLGPTGGYLIGYIPMAVVAGLAIERTAGRLTHLLGMIAGTAVLYALGTAWFCFQANYTLGAALAVCVFPFIPGDLAKILLAMTLGPVIRKRVGTI